MRVPSGAPRFVAIIVGVALLGVATEAVVEDVSSVEDITVAQETFDSDTFFCPPPSAITNPGGRVDEPAAGTQYVAAVDGPARVAFEPHEEETNDLPAGGLLARNAFERPVDVAGYDGEIVAGVTHWVGDPVLGAGATACSPTASDEWYFAQGSSVNGAVEHIVLYNPFPDPASVRVTTHRREGSNVISGLSDTEVPPNDFTVVDFTKALGPDPGDVGASIVADRGRVVAWRSMTMRVENQPIGMELSLGATAPTETSYLPVGAQTELTRTSVVLMNPNETEASVRLALLTGGRPLVPPGLGELAIPPGASQRVPLDVALEGQRIPSTFSIVIQSSVPIVAERAILSSAEEGGRSAEVASSVADESWLLLPVAVSTAGDNVVVMNPGEEDVDVEVSLHPVDGSPFSPESLRVTVGGRKRVALPLDGFPGRAPYAALVTASAPVVAERAGYAMGNQDLVSSMGVPLGSASE